MELLHGKLVDSCWSMDLLEELIFFDQKFFDQPWSQNSWYDSIKNGERYYLGVGVKEKQIVAFILYYLIPEESVAHLLKILVKPDFRRLQVAKNLYLKSEQELIHLNVEKIVLDVAFSNIPAIAFYLGHNFEKLHLMNNFYGKEQHAWSMQKKIRSF